MEERSVELIEGHRVLGCKACSADAALVVALADPAIQAAGVGRQLRQELNTTIVSCLSKAVFHKY